MIRRISIVFLSLLFFACDDSPGENQSVRQASAERTVINCDVNANTGVSWTWCCISGTIDVRAGEEHEYQYYSNRANTQVEWVVVRGSMTIVSGQNSKKVLVRFGDDFTEGQLRAIGSGDMVCSDSVYPELWD